MRVAVNLPAWQFGYRERLITIEAVRAEAGIAPRFVEIRLTESLIMKDVDQEPARQKEIETARNFLTSQNTPQLIFSTSPRGERPPKRPKKWR